MHKDYIPIFKTIITKEIIMNNFLKYNDDKLLSADMVRRLDRMSDQDREAMADNLGIDASDFQTRILLATGKEKRARDAIEDFAMQIPLVDMGAGRWVIARNIIGAAPLTKRRTQQV